MRVAYVTWTTVIAGAERSLQALLRAVPDAGVEPVVLCPEESSFLPWCREQRIEVGLCRAAIRTRWHPFRWWAAVRQMRQLLIKHRIDLIHSNQVWCYQGAGAAGGDLGLPRVCHVRNETTVEAARWFLSAGIEAVLCVSRHIEQSVAPAWPYNGITPLVQTLINPVTLPRAETACLPTDSGYEESRAAARRRFQLPPTVPILGFVGQLIPVKGVVDLLEALAGLRQPWHLLIAGRDSEAGAPYEARCRTLTAKLGLQDRVTFAGFLDDVTPFYQAIDVVVVPSLEEPLGRVPLEAAAHGKPAIVSEVGGLPETIVPGETGWLVPAGKIEPLRAAVAAWLDHPPAGIWRAARAWAEKIADPNAYARRLVAIYDQLLTQSRAKHNRAR